MDEQNKNLCIYCEQTMPRCRCGWDWRWQRRALSHANVIKLERKNKGVSRRDLERLMRLRPNQS